MASKKRVFVVGVGMTKFEKPGRRENWDYHDMAYEAGTKALQDAGIDYKEIKQVVVGYVYGDSTCGQRAAYRLGLTGVPIYNVNNNCSTGSTALYLAKQLIEGGITDCALALGFEKMERGSLSAKFQDRTNPMDKHMEYMSTMREITSAPFAPQMFGNAGREHMEKYGTSKSQIAKIAVKNHKHSVNNPYSQFRDEYTLDDILKSPAVYEPLTKLQCCPTSDGSGAAVLCNEDFVRKHKLEHQAVEILAMTMKTDTESTFNDKSCMKVVGFDMSKAAADEIYNKTGITPKDVQVVELHDCFSANELITYEALGLCPPGKAGQLIDNGDVTYGGKWVVNPSGGLISKGHPLGATGLAQCSELCWQLRGMAGPRQVKNAKIALQHNIGLGGAVVVGLYRLGFPEAFKPYPTNKPNPAIQVIPVSGQKEAPKSTPAPSGGDFKATAVFANLSKTIADNADLVKQIGGIYQFDITNGPGGKSQSWTVDLKNGKGSVTAGASGSPDCTLTVADEDFVAMMTGQANAQSLFTKGKLKMKGNMGLAMKLSKLTAAKSKL
jgi:sterol carrier protein 2